MPSVAVIEPRPATLIPFEYKFSVVVEAKPIVTDAVPEYSPVTLFLHEQHKTICAITIIIVDFIFNLC